MDGSDFSLVSLNVLLKAPAKNVVEKCLNLTFASRGDVADLTIETLMILLDASITEAEALYKALYACIEVSLTSGSVAALGALFEDEEGGSDIDGRLKNLIGQVRSQHQVLNYVSYHTAS